MSPLGFPASAGTKIRINTIFGALAWSCFIAYSTAMGIRSGKMYLGAKYGRGTTINLSQNPKRFWITTGLSIGLVAFIVWQSIREIGVTAKLAEKRARVSRGLSNQML